MKTNLISLFVKPKWFLGVMVLFSFFVLNSCKKKCEKESCGGGRYIINGNCECPPGSYWVGNRCVEKNPGWFWVDSTTCDCISDKNYFNVGFRPSDFEDPSYYDPRFKMNYIGIVVNYPGYGGSGSSVFYNNKKQTIYSSRFSYELFGKNCNEVSFVDGQFYNVGYQIRNKLKLKVYSYTVPQHFLLVDRIEQESIDQATDSCVIWMSNGL